MGTTPRFTCPWIFETLVVLSDGKVVCGCADPYGERPLGDAKITPLHDIWNSDKVRAIRRGLNEGYAPFCEPCGLKRAVTAEGDIPQRPDRGETLSCLFVETSVGCNLDCFKSVCNRASGITETRTRRLMPYEEFTGLIDQVGENLGRLDYFNYGEPFVHTRAVDMLEYVKSKYPHIYCYTSTNGLLLNDEKIRRLVDLGMDEMTFSVDGPDQETYGKYRRGGRFDRVIHNMKQLLDERNRRDKEYPLINWRYILFNWNDSRRKMNKTRRMAKKMGVDRLVWEITDHPEEAKSEKYQIGTPAWEKIYHEIWDTNSLASAIRNRRYLARLSVLGKKSRYEKGRPFTMTLRIVNAGTHHWQRAAPGFLYSVRLGAQLFDGKKRLIERDFARAFIPEDAPPGKRFVMDIEIPAIDERGRYFLKFDMVSEGLFWFEKNRSPAAWVKISIK